MAGIDKHRASSSPSRPVRNPEPLAADMAISGFINKQTFSGSLQHFEFKTGPLGIGYYDARLKASAPAAGAAPLPLVLENLIPAHACNQSSFCQRGQAHETDVLPGRRARRARHPDGGRKPRMSKRKKAIFYANAGSALATF